jgi:sulfite exporter TauE/SafE
MTALVLAFLTGLTTGGLSCLAVQGGLLASVIATRTPASSSTLVPFAPTGQKAVIPPVSKPPSFSAEATWAMLAFLLAKLFTYTLLGFLLGALGTVLQLTPLMRGTVQVIIGAFMVITALRMLNVHPIFRYLAFEPPSFVNRWIRRTAKEGKAFAPVSLGVLTVLIPCGVTQTMMALAIGTGDPWQGAGIMFAFTLGTTPLFFSLALLMTQIGKRWEHHFTKGIAVVVLVLGIVAADGGMNLLGSPFTLNRWLPSALTNPAQTTLPDVRVSLDPTATVQPTAEVAPPPAQILPPSLDPYLPQPAPSVQEPLPGTMNDTDIIPQQSLTIEVTDYGYEPNQLAATAGQSIELKLVTQNSYSCGRVFVIPVLNYETVLPETGIITLNLPPQPAGTKLYFTCGMGMYSGEIQYSS